jgi:hypothetical protein
MIASANRFALLHEMSSPWGISVMGDHGKAFAEIDDRRSHVGAFQ